MKKVIAGLLAFVLLLSGLPTQIAHASAGEELLEVIFGPESLFEALVQVACVRTRFLCQIILSPCFRGKIAEERVRFGIGP